MGFYKWFSVSFSLIELNSSFPHFMQFSSNQEKGKPQLAHTQRSFWFSNHFWTPISLIVSKLWIATLWWAKSHSSNFLIFSHGNSEHSLQNLIFLDFAHSRILHPRQFSNTISLLQPWHLKSLSWIGDIQLSGKSQPIQVYYSR